jgi:ribosomal protein S18 acetylase RimI-like enzyme
MTCTEEPCRFLEWDSSFFGRRIAQVNGNALSPERVVDVLDWCDANRIDCLYLLTESDDALSISVAEENRFGLMDIRLTFERSLGSFEPAPNDILIRAGETRDLPTLRRLAGEIHRDGRFHYDPMFGKDAGDSLYRTWIENSFNGFADAVLVADIADGAAGYVTCKIIGNSIGQIGLIGVDPCCRGVGIGKNLLSESLRWFGANGARQVIVVTQGRNCVAQRMYQKAGFVTKSVQLWYHRWFSA